MDRRRFSKRPILLGATAHILPCATHWRSVSRVGYTLTFFYVADVEAGGPSMNGELHVALDKTDSLAVFPLKGEGRAIVGRHRLGNLERGKSWDGGDGPKGSAGDSSPF